MSDLPQQDTIVQYAADGITSVYIVPFYTPVETDGTPDLDVYTQLSTATPIPADDIKEWGVDYTYTPNLDPISGGVITFLPGKIPPNSYVVTIARNVSASLDVEFSQAQTFSGFTLDAALDKLLLITQQNKSYALGRNLSYIINSYLPESTLAVNVQIPVLQAGQTWFGSVDGVIAATLEQPADVSTLRSELANNAPVTNGAALVGYYDTVNNDATTVAAQLTYLTGAVVAPFPSGAIIDFAGTAAPAGFLVCDGSEVSRATYDVLFAAIGITWGDGNGTTTFNLPDLNHRVTMGSGGSTTNPTIGTAVGDVGGEDLHTMLEAEMFQHNHPGSKGGVSVPIPSVSSGPQPSLYATGNTYAIAIANQGSSTPFNVIQKSAVVLKIIKT